MGVPACSALAQRLARCTAAHGPTALPSTDADTSASTTGPRADADAALPDRAEPWAAEPWPARPRRPPLKAVHTANSMPALMVAPMAACARVHARPMRGVAWQWRYACQATLLRGRLRHCAWFGQACGSRCPSKGRGGLADAYQSNQLGQNKPQPDDRKARSKDLADHEHGDAYGQDGEPARECMCVCVRARVCTTGTHLSSSSSSTQQAGRDSRSERE